MNLKKKTFSHHKDQSVDIYAKLTDMEVKVSSTLFTSYTCQCSNYMAGETNETFQQTLYRSQTLKLQNE